ncbi:MAG: DUF4290 domain-containing protein [Bacteroidales bacterium]|nr:DUF4290 domain-containing protein [Bacteroidales bacterium]
MEYNTQRTKLKINDYGRNIYKLIQYTKNVEDRDKRNQMASAIVDIMAQNSPDAKDAEDYKRKFWVHLMILANWELDVDVPYNITREDTVEFEPHALKYHQENAHYRHYGAIMENMIGRVAEYPEGEERDQLVRLMAHAMKRDYLLWNSDTVEDEVIKMQLEALSEQKLQLPEDFQFKDFREYLKGTDEERRANGTHKKKKKKKK